MSNRKPERRILLPSVDAVLRSDAGIAAVARFGHTALVAQVRLTLDALRASPDAVASAPVSAASVAEAASRALEEADAPKLRRVFNLTGTVVHTNLGRSTMAEAAIEAALTAMRHPATLEFNLEKGARGERDDIVRDLLRELTGAEDACVVNNNAAAVLLVLAALARGRETIVSRGELIEIGGSFRMPDIMAAAGTKLVEVGTTNRTHARDYKGAIGPETALLLKVHTSNYLIRGFTAEVSVRELAGIGSGAKIPVVDDLGSGTLIDLSVYGLDRERTVQDAIADGADLVTFSGDKLLGGPQAGFIVGRADLVRRCAKHPMKRALRLDKMRMAALEATLKLYKHTETLHETLPTLRGISRAAGDIEAQCERIAPALHAALGADFAVATKSCMSQIGSGALPLETLPSFCLAIAPEGKTFAGRRIEALAAAFRALPIPVIGRVADGALLLDLRCLDDEPGFLSGIAQLEARRPAMDGAKE